MHRCIFALALLFGCASNHGEPATLRPGVQDSSQGFIGTPSTAEVAFWESVRNADANARMSAVIALKSDLANDPGNGYSAFLAASSAFIQGADLINPLAAGQPVPAEAAVPELYLPSDVQPLLQQGLNNMTDPFYVGIDATLLAVILKQSDADAATKTWAYADAQNFVGSSVGRTTWSLAVSDFPGALELMYQWLKYCSKGTLDSTNPDVGAFVDAANAGALMQRECYSGYYAMHGTEGALLQIGDLYATAGNAQVASLYYNAMPRATNYATWPLLPLAERRIAGTQPVKSTDLTAVISCATCHVNTVP